MKIKKKFTKNLTNTDLIKIFKLKKIFWNYSLKSQKNWFKVNVKDTDINFLFFDKKILIGYCLISNKKISFRNSIKSAFLLDSVVMKSSYSSKMFIYFMKKIKQFLKNKDCFLVCKKRYLKFYIFLDGKK